MATDSKKILISPWFPGEHKQLSWFFIYIFSSCVLTIDLRFERRILNSIEMEASEYFYINIIGQIDFAYYPIGFDGTKLFCRYDMVAGPDWELISGMSAGVTQNASVGSSVEKVVFNMPLEMMFKSTNPYGCKFTTK